MLAASAADERFLQKFENQARSLPKSFGAIGFVFAHSCHCRPTIG
jgi:hypothetical protein